MVRVGVDPTASALSGPRSSAELPDLVPLSVVQKKTITYDNNSMGKRIAEYFSEKN